jgi:signal transduction histidine kinase
LIVINAASDALSLTVKPNFDRWGWKLSALFVLLLIGAVVMTLGHVLAWFRNVDQVKWLSVTIELLAASIIYGVANRFQGQVRLAWSWIAASVAAFAFGELLWVMNLPLLGQENLIVALFYASSPLFSLYGFLRFPQKPFEPLERLKVSLDIVIIAISGIYLYWRIFPPPEGLSFEQVTLVVGGFVYLFIHLFVVATTLVPTMIQKTLFLGPHFILLAVAELLFVSSNSPSNSYLGRPWGPDQFAIPLWMWAVTMYAIAALTSLRVNQFVKLQLPQCFEEFGRTLPYLGMFTVFYCLATYALEGQSRNPAIERGAFIVAGIVLLLVIWRQLVAFTEITRLSRNLNELNQNLESRVLERAQQLEQANLQLLTAEKLAALGKLTAGLAHEINTPLATAMSATRQAQDLALEYQRSIPEPSVSQDDHLEIASELRARLDETQRAQERLGEFIRRVRAQTRNAKETNAKFDPTRVIRETLVILASEIRAANVSVQFNAPTEALELRGEHGRFAQIVQNLVQNALHACEANSGTVQITLNNTVDALELSVRDNGTGIPEEVRSNIFDPMFTTKPVGKGTGLGLLIVMDTVKAHFGGEISFETQVGLGTAFTLIFPHIYSTQF